jgi:hypothetical protein
MLHPVTVLQLSNLMPSADGWAAMSAGTPQVCWEQAGRYRAKLWGACAAGMATAAADGVPARESAAAEPSQEWTEEREAVEAIHGDAASFPSPSRTLLSLPLPAEAAAILRMPPEVGLVPAVEGFWHLPL